MKILLTPKGKQDLGKNVINLENILGNIYQLYISCLSIIKASQNYLKK
jgi:hypothetical protein